MISSHSTYQIVVSTANPDQRPVNGAFTWSLCHVWKSGVTEESNMLMLLTSPRQRSPKVFRPVFGYKPQNDEEDDNHSSYYSSEEVVA